MEKLLAIAGLGQKVYGRWLFYRLLSGMLVILSLAIIASMLVGTITIGALYIFYLYLLHAGIAAGTALFIVGSLSIACTALVIVCTIIGIRRLYEMPSRLLEEKLPKVSEVKHAMEAFLNGLLNPPADKL